MVRNKQCTTKTTTDTADDVNDGYPQPPGKLFQISHYYDLYDDGHNQLDEPEIDKSDIDKMNPTRPRYRHNEPDQT